VSDDESLDELALNLIGGCQGPLDWQYVPRTVLRAFERWTFTIDRTMLADFKAGGRNIGCIHALGRRYLGRYSLCPRNETQSRLSEQDKGTGYVMAKMRFTGAPFCVQNLAWTMLICGAGAISSQLATANEKGPCGTSGEQAIQTCSEDSQTGAIQQATSNPSRSNDDNDESARSRNIANLTEVIRHNLKDPRPLIERGTVYADKGDFSSAIADYNLAIALDPSNVTAYVARGNAYRDKGDLNRAIADYKLAIMLAPTNAQAYNNRAIAYSLKGYLDRAMADFDQAITHDPTHAESYYNRGRFYFKKGDVDNAISDFDQAIKIDPKFVNAYNRRGLRYSDKGDFDHAIADFSQAIAIAPKNADAYSHRCWARLVSGRQLQEALSDCNESLSIRPNDADTLNSRGLLFLKLNRSDDAIADFNAAAKLDVKLVSSIYGRGLAKLGKNDSAGADADMSAARAKDTDVAQELARYGIK
jgi:tetratricopeptide (TPR) repeat protein